MMSNWMVVFVICAFVIHITVSIACGIYAVKKARKEPTKPIKYLKRVIGYFLILYSSTISGWFSMITLMR